MTSGLSYQLCSGCGAVSKGQQAAGAPSNFCGASTVSAVKQALRVRSALIWSCCSTVLIANSLPICSRHASPEPCTPTLCAAYKET